MAGANVHEFTDANFQSEVLAAPGPVLVDFWAEWCGPCKAIAPMIDRLADRFAGKVKVGKVNTDNSRNTAVQYGINAIPTLMVFKGGKLVTRFVGIKGEAEIAGALEAAMK